MSKELTGQGGYIVGSQNYFRSLNEKTFIANFMQNKSGTSYYEALTSVSSKIYTIKRAIEWGENNAIGSSTEKAKFLSAVMQGKNREFLGDVWLKLLYTNNPKEFTGRCGRVICTSEYIDHIEQHVFGGNIPNYYAYRGGDRAYGNLTLQSLYYNLDS